MATLNKLIGLSLLLLFCGCEPPLTEGFVYEKAFSPAYDNSGMRYEYDFMKGEFSLHWVSDSAPDRWWIRYKKLVNDATGEYRFGERQVDQATFDRFKEGDWISFGGDL